jgi:hypothetical protein
MFVWYNMNNNRETCCYISLYKYTTMSRIKEHLYHIQEEQYEEYLEYSEKNKELYEQLPKILGGEEV